ncbi:hypothetical protein [Massilia sp. YMA4]|uniref:hypothetical protein n=1 Tax=Massilia sp. YMA4 TaxID=1593482 RepID=UPI000DD11295|nr:hypothetical protein [Massilia sp. YMA4]AXA91163.1 hypothetical protein DPH57_08325 [Massilia sp. YMA4]
MKALLRLLVLWLLLAGVPLQGFASATMLLCAPQADMSAHAVPVHGEHHAHADAHAGMEHDQATTHHGGDMKCASAAFCCAGAPLAGTMPLPPLAPTGSCAPIPFDTTAPPAVDLAGLERPPKHLA